MPKIILAKPRKWKRRPEILLGPPIPQPMHGMSPRVVLGSKWWNKTRQEVYKSTDYHCVACGVFKTDAKGKRWLEAHEIYDTDYLLGKMVYVEAVPLCHYCHNFCHPGRMQALLEANMLTHAKYAAIIQHGALVLRSANLRKPDYSKPILTNCKAKDWRLVIDGVEYAAKDHVKEFRKFSESTKTKRKAEKETETQYH